MGRWNALVLASLRSRIFPLVWYEMKLSLRGGGGLGVLLICCVVGSFVGGADGMTPSLVGYRVARISAIMLGFLSLPLLATAARRDALTHALDTVQSRPHLAQELVLTRWLGNLAFLAALLSALALFAFGAQAISGPVLDGEGPRVSLRAFADAMLAGLLPLVFLSTLGYCVAELLQNVLAAAVIALYWLFVLLGHQYVSRTFDFSLSQNAAVYMLLSVGVVLTAMAVARFRQGLKRSRKLDLPLLAALFLFLGLGLGWRFSLTRHDPPMNLDPMTQTVAGQSIRMGRLPGFWLTDQWGKLARLHNYDGRALVVGFWSPTVPESVTMLADLHRVHQDYAGRGVQVIGVCIAPDVSTGRRFGLERGYEFPMVTDDGTHWSDSIEDSSPLAEAYGVDTLPMVFLADRSRRLVRPVSSAAWGQEDALNTTLTEILSGQTGQTNGEQGRAVEWRRAR